MLDVLPPDPRYFDIYNDLTQTPLHLAVITGQHKIAGKLIEKGANIDLVDRNGQTCVHLACQRGDLKSLRTIFKRQQGRVEVQEKLQEILDARNFDGKLVKISMFSVSGGNLRCMCLSFGANDINLLSFLGLTPLCVATKANHVEIVKELIVLGADVNAVVSSFLNSKLTLFK